MTLCAPETVKTLLIIMESTKKKSLKTPHVLLLSRFLSALISSIKASGNEWQI